MRKEFQEWILFINFLSLNGISTYQKQIFCESFSMVAAFRSRHSQIFFRIGVLKNVAIFTENTCPGVSLLKKRLQHRYFPVNIANFLRTVFYKEHLWLLQCIPINPFHATGLFLQPLKTSETSGMRGVPKEISGLPKKISGIKRVKIICIAYISYIA